MGGHLDRLADSFSGWQAASSSLAGERPHSRRPNRCSSPASLAIQSVVGLTMVWGRPHLQGSVGVFFLRARQSSRRDSARPEPIEVLLARIQSACSSRVSENFLEQVLRDDRLPKHVVSIAEQINTDLDLTMQLPLHFLELCGSVARRSPDELRSEIARVSLVQAGYLNDRLREVHELPWSLLQGDMGSKLESLQHGPAPQEAVASEIISFVAPGLSHTDHRTRLKSSLGVSMDE